MPGLRNAVNDIVRLSREAVVIAVAEFDRFEICCNGNLLPRFEKEKEVGGALAFLPGKHVLDDHLVLVAQGLVLFTQQT